MVAVRYRKTWVSRLALAIPFALLGAVLAHPDVGARAYVVLLVVIYAALASLVGRGWIEVDDRGVRQRTWRDLRDLTWDQIATFHYSANPRGRGSMMAGMMVTGAAGAIASAAESKIGKVARIAYVLSLDATDGRRVTITSGFRRADEAIRTILGRIQGPILESARRELASGATVELGPVQISKDGVRFSKRNRNLALAKIEKVDLFIDGKKTLFRILEHRKAWPYARVDARKLCTPVALELFHDLGVAVEIPNWFAP